MHPETPPLLIESVSRRLLLNDHKAGLEDQILFLPYLDWCKRIPPVKRISFLQIKTRIAIPHTLGPIFFSPTSALSAETRLPRLEREFSIESCRIAFTLRCSPVNRVICQEECNPSNSVFREATEILYTLHVFPEKIAHYILCSLIHSIIFLLQVIASQA